MDKYDQILDLIEHPENYTSQEVEDLLANQEMREFYNLLCKTGGALHSSEKIDVDAEWRAFSRKNFKKRFKLVRPGSRAASIAALVFATAAALAIGTGVAVKVISDQNRKSESVKVKAAAEEDLSLPTDTIIVETKGESADAPVLFANETLDTVLNTMAEHYGKELRYLDFASGELYLHYKWDPKLALEEVLDQLNTFGQINLCLEGNTIIVDKP